MKLTDENMWLQMKLQYQSGGEFGKNIVRFTELWAGRMESRINAMRMEGSLVDYPSAKDAALVEISAVEGHIPVELITESLVLLSQFWTYGEDLINTLTPIEMGVFSEQMASMIRANQEAAHVEFSSGGMVRAG